MGDEKKALFKARVRTAATNLCVAARNFAYVLETVHGVPGSSFADAMVSAESISQGFRALHNAIAEYENAQVVLRIETEGGDG